VGSPGGRGMWRDRHRRQRRTGTPPSKLKLCLQLSGFCQRPVEGIGADI
jgi:hypothetical protein